VAGPDGTDWALRFELVGTYSAHMVVDADSVASGLASVWEYLLAAIPDGWTRRENGVIAAVSRVPLAALNGVWPERSTLDELAVSALLDEVASSGLPYCVQLRPGSDERLASMIARRGMVAERQVPLMVLEDSSRLPKAQDVQNLEIRQITPEEGPLHARIAARGFEAPEHLFVQLMASGLLGLPGVRCYVGETDGDAVTTGLGVTLGPSVGIFNIATPPEHRGHGFGAAVTARAVTDGLDGGARWSFLQSSSAGYEIYKRLGFLTLEHWDCWTASS
jgi:GNAT superfamily N-acetyltransferase